MITRMEIEVACCAATGMSYEEAAAHLHLGKDTVKTHLKRARQRTGAKNTVELVASLIVEKLVVWDVRDGIFRPNQAMFGG